MATLTPFDLVSAAEQLLQNAKAFAASRIPGQEDDLRDLRRAIAQTARKIWLETAPTPDVVRADWITSAEVNCTNLFIDWKAFDHIPLDGHISVADLARKVDAEEALVARIANLLLCTGRLLPGPRDASASPTLRHSRISRLFLSHTNLAALYTVCIGHVAKPGCHWPEYFDIYGRHEPRARTIPTPPGPTDGSQHTSDPGRGGPAASTKMAVITPFSYAWGRPDLTPDEIKARYPKLTAAFARGMSGNRVTGDYPRRMTGPGAVYDYSWIGEEARKMPGDARVVVDVGGELGHLLVDLLRDVDGLRPEQCVLQGRGKVIERAMKERGDGVLKGVWMMGCDFLEEQPVKGALAYILRHCLVNHTDRAATNILRHLADALPKDNPKARVIIIEEKFPSPPVPSQCLLDIGMLNLGGKLRNEEMLRKVAEPAGLIMVGYYTRDEDTLAMAECKRA